MRTVAPAGAAPGLALYPNLAPGGAATLTGVRPGTVVRVYDALGRPLASTLADAVGPAVLACRPGCRAACT